MKPLTKDKIKIILSKEADKDLDKIISDLIKDFGFKEDQKKVLKDLLIGIFLMHKQKEKEKVEWLLKEIEKEIRESEEREYEAQKEDMILEVENEQGYQEGLRDAIRIIKKAFEGIE